MAPEESSVTTFTHSAVSVPEYNTKLESATPTNLGTNLGFIIALCIAEKCLGYFNENIEAVDILMNYNITNLPADAFRGASYIKVTHYYTITHTHIYTKFSDGFVYPYIYIYILKNAPVAIHFTTFIGICSKRTCFYHHDMKKNVYNSRWS